MSTGIDKEFVRMHYKRMKDAELIQVVTDSLTGLTPDALEIIKEEIIKRHLGNNLIEHLEQHSAKDTSPAGYKVFDKDACPVDEPMRIQIENSFLMLLSIFGKENTIHRKVLVPSPVHFPIRYNGTEQNAFETLSIVAAQMEVPGEKIKLDFYDDIVREITEGSPGGLYWGEGEDGLFEISLVRTKLSQPQNMVATLAHEVAHIKLLGENRLEENDEFLTELTTIFFGLGVFNANAAFQDERGPNYYTWSESGYLTQMEWGYALALFAYIRQEEEPAWADYLCANVKADFKQGLNFIINNEENIFNHL